MLNSNFFTENECENPTKDRFEAATRVLNHAEQLIYAIQDAKEYAEINKFDDMLKQVEAVRLAALEYAALMVINGTINKLSDNNGDK